MQEEKMDTTVKSAHNQRTYKNEHGNYPKWMSRKKVDKLKKIGKKEADKIKKRKIVLYHMR